MSLTFGSLFAGIGGIDLGLERAGLECRWQVEIDDYASRVLARHWPDVRRWGDVRTFPPDMADAASLGRENDEQGCGDEAAGESPRWMQESIRGNSLWEVDLIAGGFPCQDISYAGKGRGLDGERSGLWFEYARIVRTLRPRYVLVENVSALLARGMDAVLGTLASLGYDAEWHCIPAASLGAPHIRDRVFILAYARREQPESRGVAGNLARSARASEAHGEERQRHGHAVEHRGPTLLDRSSLHEFRDSVGREQWSIDPAADGQSGMGRVVDGIPDGMDRLRGLGNAVVPQIAEFVGRRILEADARAGE